MAIEGAESAVRLIEGLTMTVGTCGVAYGLWANWRAQRRHTD